MANTTNFGWETPDDTDLVKDGAAAMRTLGNAIDASLVDLKGGTTNQVLAKNSNTDMDFKWVETDDTNAIQNAIVDAKGDLIAASAADTPARLAVGNNGETLVADSSTSTGLRWQEPKTNNFTINGDCRIAQRGTAAITLSSSTSTHFPVDRFWVTGHSGATTQQQSSISLTGFTNAVRVTRTAGNTTTTDLSFVQTFETAASIPLQGKAVVLSFWARAGANFSPSSSTLTSRVYTGTGTDQGGFGFSWTGTANPINQGNTLTTSWQRFTATGTISASATQVQLFFFCSPTGTAGANDWFEITGVQLEIGSVATPFRTATGTLAGELDACMRYYQVVTRDNYAYLGQAYSTSGAAAPIIFLKPMRVSPSITLAAAGSGSGQITFLTSTAGIPGTVGTLSAVNITLNGFRLEGSGFTGSFTAGNAALLFAGSATTEVWRASAEL